METLANRQSYNADAPLPDTLPTDDASVEIQKLLPSDVPQIHALMHANADHLKKGGLEYEWKYPTEESLKADITDNDASDIYGVKFNGEFVGGLNVHTHTTGEKELARWVNKEHAGKGIGSTVLKALIREADALGVPLLSTIQAGNFPSMKSVENNGFKIYRNIPSFSASIKPARLYRRPPSK